MDAIEDLYVWFNQKEIKQDFSPSRRQQCNGIAERKDRFTIEVKRVLIIDSDLPMEFWTYAGSTVVSLENKRKLAVHQISADTACHERKPSMSRILLTIQP